MATVQTPGAPVVQRPRSGKGGLCAGGCCGCGALFGLLAILGIVIGGHAMFEAAIVSQLETEVGPAAEWNADFATFAPLKWMLGQPADLTITGRDVTVEGQFQASDVAVDIDGLAVDLGGEKVKSVDKATFDVAITGDSLAQMVKQEMGAEAEQVSIALENNKLMFMIDMPLGDQSAAVTVATTPKVIPPTKLKLAVDDITIDTTGLPAEMVTAVEQVKPMLRTELENNLTFDVAEQGENVVLESVTIEGDAMRVKGEVPPEVMTAP